MNKPITTIIPFFNSDGTIATMLESILSGFVIPDEILLIDDGSDDSSPSIARDYSARYPFIKYIRQNHAGVSAARNLGIRYATSSWISFLDADDYIEKTMYEQMQAALTGDVSGCICGYFTEKDGISTEYTPDVDDFLSSDELLKAMFTDDNIRGFLFTRLFKAELIKDNAFRSDISLCEDLLFQTDLLTQNPNLKFVCVQAPLYHYVQNDYSVTNSLNVFNNGVFKYKPAFDEIKKLAPFDYVDESYTSILHYNMYCLLKNYRTGNKKNKAILSHIRNLQRELKSFPRNASSSCKQSLAFKYAPILYSYFMK
ncbi:glycosyltransferase family 2 protein [Pseudobutyrivibrio xylanivorans]|nr:glycosyltransferase family 2 protein [Pseudobutyrivibrio xylanivorans]